jgi:hypothetical protein
MSVNVAKYGLVVFLFKLVAEIFAAITATNLKVHKSLQIFTGFLISKL